MQGFLEWVWLSSDVKLIRNCFMGFSPTLFVLMIWNERRVF